MIIKKLLNNNVVIASTENGDEVVVMGTGLGFKAKIGDKVNKDKIQKVFVLKEYGSKLTELIEDIPIEFLEITEKIVEFAKNEYNLTLEKAIYLSLTDHIHFAIERQRMKMNLENPFLQDVKQFYVDEYKIGLYARKIIEEKVKMAIPDDEVAFIAMHIVESEYGQDRRSVGNSMKLMNEVLDQIVKGIDMNIDESSLKFNRLIIHIKYFARRYIKNKEEDHKDKLLNETLKKAFPKEFTCVEKISLNLGKKYGREISDSEKCYLVIHLRNCENLKN